MKGLFKILFAVTFFCQCFVASGCVQADETYVITAKEYLDYIKKMKFHYPSYAPPEIVIICYQRELLEYALNKQVAKQEPGILSELHLLNDGRIAVFGGFGVGSPALIDRLEKLIAFGVKKIIAIGTAGTLTDNLTVGDAAVCTKSLGEDGVSYQYLPKGTQFAFPNEGLVNQWQKFYNKNYQAVDLSPLKPVVAWTNANYFRETPQDIIRVMKLGCTVAEMESAGLYAISQEKNIPALALFIISDSSSHGKWKPTIKDPIVMNNLKKLYDLTLKFSMEQL